MGSLTVGSALNGYKKEQEVGEPQPSAFLQLPSDLQREVAKWLPAKGRASARVLAGLSKALFQVSPKLQLRSPEQASQILEWLCLDDVPDEVFNKWLEHTPADCPIRINAHDNIKGERLQQMKQRFKKFTTGVSLIKEEAVKKIAQFCPESLHTVEATYVRSGVPIEDLGLNQLFATFPNIKVFDFGLISTPVKQNITLPETLEVLRFTPRKEEWEAKDVQALVGQCPNLRELTLPKMKPGELAKVVYSPTLQKVHFGEAVSAAEIQRVFDSCPNLIDISFTTEDDLTSLRFPSNLQRIMMVHIMNNQETRHLLKSCPNLRELGMWCHITREAFFEKDADGVEQKIPCPNLQRLQFTLADYEKDRSGLIQILESFPHLKELNADGYLSSELPLFAKLKDLERVKMDTSHFFPSRMDIQTIFNSWNNTLVEFEFESDVLGDLAKEDFMALRFPASLRILNLSKTAVDREILDKILNDCRNLEKVHLNDCKNITEGEVQQLRKLHRQIHFVTIPSVTYFLRDRPASD